MTDSPNNKPAPWLIAAWPGMSSVALIAAGYLVNHLRMRPIGEISSPDRFDIEAVEFRNGLVAPAHLPRGVFFRWSNPGPGRDLVVFLGEAQPATGTYAYAQELLDAPAAAGAERIITFASMATQLHPADNPRVSGVATDAATLAELGRAEVEPLAQGQIAGLNGVLLAAAAARGIPGLCLLAEVPSFAIAVPNPKAARAALSVFCILAGVDVSLDELNEQAAVIDHALMKVVRKLQQQHEAGDEEAPDDETLDETPDDASDEDSDRPLGEQAAARSEAMGDEPVGPVAAQPDAPTLHRIEQMFDDAARDAALAAPLKAELDRLRLFERYEDRFLDLFRRAA